MSPIRLQYQSTGFLRLVLDGIAIIGSLWLAKELSPGSFDSEAVQTAMVATIAFILFGHLTGLYRLSDDMSADQEVACVSVTWIVTLMLLGGLAFYTRYGQYFARSVILSWSVLAPVSMCAFRMLQRIAQRLRFKNGIGTRRVAIAGLNDLGLQVAKNIENDPTMGFSLTGFFDDRDSERLPNCEQDEAQLLGSIDDLVASARSREFDIVLISLPMRAEARIKFILEQLRDSTTSVYIVPDFFVFEMMHSRWTNMGGIPAVSIFETPLYGIDGVSKRVLDLIAATGALLVAAVPMLVISILVKLTSPGPILFRQKRYGMEGQEIMVWKFRSMTTCDNGPVVKQATKNDARITPLGAVLRKTSLDELPQLFNVLSGSMSLVGPRPHATAHNEEYRHLIRGYMLRHKIKPGITGLAQVEGCRGETDTLDKMQRRVDFDHRYIRDWSLWLDIKILFKTLRVAWSQPEAY